MKKIFSFLLIFAALSTYAVNGFDVAKPVAPNAANIKFMVKNGEEISLLQLSKISLKDYENLTGRKMNGLAKLEFKLAQNKLAHGINAEGKITNKKLLKAFYPRNGQMGNNGFHMGGFLLGFLLSLIGVLIAYVLPRTENFKRRVTWAWVGAGVNLLVNILLFRGFYF